MNNNYKAFVGNPDHYDLIGVTQFALLAFYGLKTTNKVLDIGCGSLRLGKYLIPFLRAGNYYGIEPNKWLVDEALKNETIDAKKEKANFSYVNTFDLGIFNKRFDWLIANSIFIHACLGQIEKCFCEAYKVMKPNAEFIFNYIEGEDNIKTEWSYPSSVTYKRATLKRIAESKGFVWNDFEWYYPGKQKWVKLYKAEISV